MRPARIILVAVLLLAAGAAVNVAVAWGCAAALRLTFGQSTQEAEPGGWPIPAPQAWGAPTVYIFVDGFGGRMENWSNVSGPGWSIGESDTSGMMTAETFGWPMRSLRRVRLVPSHKHPGLARPGVLVPWLSTAIDASQPVDFPVDVRPMAFATNTVFYTAVLAGPWVVWKVVRRVRRRKLGLCAACGYDVKGLGVCPECGRSLRAAG